MGEVGETFRALREMRQEEGFGRRDQAENDFEAVAEWAASLGFRLVRCSGAHYQIAPADRSWLINVYPGNGRICADRNRAPAPYLRVPKPWSLIDIVAAAHEACPGVAPPEDVGGAVR